MNLHYRIIEADENAHQIVVRYWTDRISEISLRSDDFMRDSSVPLRCRTDISLSLPIPTPSSEEIQEILLRHAPIEFFKTLENVLDPDIDTNMDSAKSLLNVKFSKTQEELDEYIRRQTPESIDELTEEDIEKLIKSITSDASDTES